MKSNIVKLILEKSPEKDFSISKVEIQVTNCTITKAILFLIILLTYKVLCLKLKNSILFNLMSLFLY